MKSEFEEKSYEGAFNAELTRGAGMTQSSFFPPGQVLESDLGFDAAWMIGATHPFWKMVGRISRQGMDVSNRTKRKFPSKMYNLFIQYKRSEYIWRANGTHHIHFSGPYYRFKFNDPEKQLKVLKQLERKVGNGAHVLYAAPEFHTIDQLVDAIDTNTVVSRSVIARPRDLKKNHTSFNFKAGHRFLQNPEPEDVEGIHGNAFLTQLSSNEREIQTLPEGLETINEALFSIRIWRVMWRKYEPFIEPRWLEQETQAKRELALRYLAASSFAAVYGLSWTLGSGPTSSKLIEDEDLGNV